MRIIILLIGIISMTGLQARDYMNMEPKIMTEAEAPDYTNDVGESIKMLLQVHETAGQFTMFTDTFQDKTTVGAHHHNWHDETFYVIRGSFEIANGDLEDKQIVTEGTVVFTPRGTEHTWTANEPDSKVLVVYTPGGWDQFIDAWYQLTDEQKEDEAFVDEFLKSYDENFQ